MIKTIQAKNLNKHLKNHEKSMVYNFDACLKVFSSQKYLKRQYKCLLDKNLLRVNLVTRSLLVKKYLDIKQLSVVLDLLAIKFLINGLEVKNSTLKKLTYEKLRSVRSI